jgi:ketosteroid isomerase-like protein
MKADELTQTEVTQTLKGMFSAYKKKDVKGVLSFWAPDSDVVIIGSGTDEKSVGRTQFSATLKRDFSQAEITGIDFRNFAVSSSGLVAWFSADMTLRGITDDREFSLPGRLTGVMENRDGKWLWVQMHYSIPSSM